MKPKILQLLLLLGAGSCAVEGSCFATDWPQWRGPKRNGISSEKIPAFSPNGPKLAWSAFVGTGFSSISVSERRLYTMGNTNEHDVIWCLNAETGGEIWSHTYPSRLDPQYYEGGPGATPTIDAGRVFTINKWGTVLCLDAVKGTKVWQHNLWEEGIRSNRWGFAGSPLLWNDLVILNAGAAGTALDRATGRMIWFNGTNPAGYASPTLVKISAKEIVLIFAAKHLVAVDPKNGRELWRFPFETGYDTNNSDPLIHGDTVFISSFTRGCALLRLHLDKAEVIYEKDVHYNHLSPGLLLGEYLYAFNGEAKTKTDFRCLHVPTGEVKWTTRTPAFGSLIGLGDNRLLILSDKGELILAAGSPAEFNPLARAQVLGGLCWTPPTIANGLIYVRNAKGDLKCFDARPQEAP